MNVEQTQRAAFEKHNPKLAAELSLGENNPDFRGLEDINARHAWRHFKAGWLAAQRQMAPDALKFMIQGYRAPDGSLHKVLPDPDVSGWSALVLFRDAVAARAIVEATG